MTTPAAGLRSGGWLMVASALTLVGYVVIALTIGADFEHDLEAAADRAGVAVNQVASATQSQITHDHALYAGLTAVFLFVPPLLLLLAVTALRRAVTGARRRARGGRRWRLPSSGGRTTGWASACSPTPTTSRRWSGTSGR